MIEPPIDERYELAAVKDSLTPDERTTAEKTYTRRAFDYEQNPVGSRDWTLFWSGWCARAVQPNKAQPPCGADGAVLADRDYLGRAVREAWVRWALTQPNPKQSWLAPYDDLSEPDKEADRQIGEHIAALLASQPAAPVAQSDTHQTLLRLFSLENGDDPIPYVKRLIAGTTTYHDAFNGRAPMPTPVAPATVAVPDGWRVKDDGHCVSVCWDGACYTLDDRQGSVYEAFCGFVRDVVKRAVTQPQAVQAVADAARTITVESELVEGGLYVIRALPHVDDPEFAKGKLQYFTRNPDHLGRLRLWKHFSGNYEALAVTLPEFPAMLAASQREGGG